MPQYGGVYGVGSPYYDSLQRRNQAATNRPQTTGTPGINELVFGTSPMESDFYAGQIGRAGRALSAQYQPIRSAALDALEARGFGRSSEVGRTLSGLGAAQGSAYSDAISDIGAQQFSGRQARINAYLNFLFQKQIQKGGGKTPFDYLSEIGGALPYLLSKGQPGNSGAPGGYGDSPIPGGYRYEPGNLA